MASTSSVDEGFRTPADEARLDRTAEALRRRGFEVHLVPDRATARLLVAGLIPSQARVLTAASETLREIGLADDIDRSGRFDAIRPRLMGLDFHRDADERRRLGGVPDVIVGSVQAITEDGRVVAASATGSQLAPYAYGAAAVIWVVGAQKIVPDLDSAFRRVEEHCYPLEDQRARRVYGQPSSISKTLIIEREPFPGRITIVLIPEALGY